MRIRIVTAVLLCAVLGSVVACQSADDTKSTDVGAPSTAASTPTSSAPTDDGKADAEKATVPDFVGMGLQSAQDKAQELGFYGLVSHDALGRDRMQAFDRNWKVCSQNVAADKTVPTDTELDFGTVKLEETCPAKEEKAPSAEGGTMPDFKGKSVKTARTALDSGTSLTVNDATADDRFVLVESNWQVCTQEPAAGAALNGQPVTFTAVKFGETCP